MYVDILSDEESERLRKIRDEDPESNAAFLAGLLFRLYGNLESGMGYEREQRECNSE